ncbi:MAG: hypothetical protein B7Z08_07015 [Sphingomonadales bacterium 32-68-7]|nr:MAG: hypothetical protein B7Z08_07015 [Sphingomonadales bacterium 32-68-7]
MSANTMPTDRRSFLKHGAMVAAPIAAVAVPSAALAADDGSRAKLARLQDERAIEALHRSFLRQINGAGDCAALVTSSDAVAFEPGLRAIAEDHAHDTQIVLADDGRSASGRCACTVELATEFTGDTTIERMARFEGQGSHRHEEPRVLATEFVKAADGWRISSARFV